MNAALCSACGPSAVVGNLYRRFSTSGIATPLKNSSVKLFESPPRRWQKCITREGGGAKILSCQVFSIQPQGNKISRFFFFEEFEDVINLVYLISLQKLCSA